MNEQEQVSDTKGRTRLRYCSCGQEKMQVCERESGETTLILCAVCDKAAIAVILHQ